MPVKSEKQRRFMYASLAGKTDVPPSVAKKFVGPDAHKADGGAVKESEMKSKKMMFGAANKVQEQRGSAMKKAGMKKYAAGGPLSSEQAAALGQAVAPRPRPRPGGQVTPYTPTSPNAGALPPEQVAAMMEADRRGRMPPAPTPPLPGPGDLPLRDTPPAPTPPRPRPRPDVPIPPPPVAIPMPRPRPGPTPPSTMPIRPPGMKKGGAAKGYAKGGSTRADGCATKGHTKGKMVKMAGGGKC